MGLKKAWTYDSTMPAELAEELGFSSFQPPSPVRCSNFGEKQAALESHSLSATGDLESEGVRGWLRISVAARAHELKKRTVKTQDKSRRFTCPMPVLIIDGDAKKESRRPGECGFGLDTNKAGSGEASMTNSPSPPAKAAKEHKRSASEPISIKTVDDLIQHLKKIGRWQSEPSSKATASKPKDLPVQPFNEPNTAYEIGDSSFDSQFSAESEATFCNRDPALADAKAKDDESQSNTKVLVHQVY
ncbi:uncharacterized protein FOMMEDRAFT_25425 [Fomitiporia mediterranea MF3/22]|uniref:uncharacterized protein n=1 Tax=Fomitiporia mediterranea (strain MF3/22) TaxID=694068 RepID=UPI0004408680|nr:uncharacterized protein FOMMEDRAFT_25425 [Fomitiporia mediterranea MF3/22]EJD08304.1 hypothetical protein FOMMEDRAFT_25425 [Fomitiporia mediterranea MF3/22]